MYIFYPSTSTIVSPILNFNEFTWFLQFLQGHWWRLWRRKRLQECCPFWPKVRERVSEAVQWQSCPPSAFWPGVRNGCSASPLVNQLTVTLLRKPGLSLGKKPKGSGSLLLSSYSSIKSSWNTMCRTHFSIVSFKFLNCI